MCSLSFESSESFRILKQRDITASQKPEQQSSINGLVSETMKSACQFLSYRDCSVTKGHTELFKRRKSIRGEAVHIRV